VAQVGRISGPLLEENLLRKGFTNNTSQDDLKFKNTNSDTTLLKIDVTNGRLGIDLEAPANALHVSQTLRTVNLIGDTANVANFNFSNNNINVDGNFYLDASDRIQLSNLETEQFFVSDNFITTKDTNANIEILPNGTGTVEIPTNLNITGSLHSTGNITFDGSVTFGDSDTDDVSFNADIADNIHVPEDDVYNLGGASQRWSSIYTNLVNGQLVTSGNVSVDGAEVNLRLGNILYVSKNGSDSNVGDHPNGPLLTIKEALARCDASTAGNVTIYVFPGVYEEICPLVLPEEVTLTGTDLRNVVIKPTVATQSNDIFHLSDSCTISKIAVKDFYYDSINDTGYAFRFASGEVITKRSPYVQDVTVITKGSTTTADDPRGFAAGDAGRGALIDGAELDSASIEASMLFHSCTFICPNADVINMTNGVRVEWLNSFTYFANRGLYAFNSATGRTTYDGSTVKYGAEIRSIGSANVYGNYGAVADGADCLMYLIQHNFAYIGVGKYVDNDQSRAIQSQEVTELNNGKIHFTTTDHTGSFRIGDNFLVDFETGNTTINLDDLIIDQFNALRIVQGANETTIDGAYIDVGNFTLRGNTIQSNGGPINITAANGEINLQDNTNIAGNLDISGDLSYGGVLNISGDDPSDSLIFNVEFEQNFNPNQSQTFNLGSFTERWLVAHLDRVESNDITIFDNVIQTNISNADLELRADSNNKILIPSNNFQIENNFEVKGTATLGNTNITGTLTVVGDTNYTGNVTTENLNVTGNLNVNSIAQFEEILIDDNYITTTSSNADLEIRANGTGTINLQEYVNVTNNLSADNIDATNVTATINVTSDNANIGNIEINDNYIETTSLNGDLNLVSDRNIFVRDTDVTFEQDLTINGTTILNSDLGITGTITQTSNTTQTGNVTLNGEFTNGDILIEDNFVTTTNSNSNLELRASGTGEILVPTNNVQINNNLTVSSLADLQSIIINGPLTHIGNRNQIGGYTQGGELTVDNVYVEDNFISTLGGNLTIQASGTGEVLIPNNNVQINNNLTVSTDTDLQGTTIIGSLTHTGDRNQTGNFTLNGEWTVDNVYLEDNFISTTTGNLTLQATGDINVDANDVEIAQDLTVSGATDLQGTTITGTITQTGNRTQTGNLDVAGEITNGNILIEDNFITTTNTNSDLELRASGTGEIVIDSQDTVTINNNLFVGGTMSYNGSLTINGNVILQSNTQDGSLTVTDNLEIAATLDVSQEAQFEEILIDDNYITTTSSNADLEIRANGIGEILVPNNNLKVNNNLFTASISTTDITINNDLVLDELVITDSNIEIAENYLTTKTSNTSLELRANGNGEILIPNNNVQIDNNLVVSGNTDLQDIDITGILTHNNDTSQVGNLSITGSLDATGSLTVGSDANFKQIQLIGNFVNNTTLDSNLELRASGTGNVIFKNDTQITNDVSTRNLTLLGPLQVNQILDITEFNVETNIRFRDNFIETTESNSDLELRSLGSKGIFVEKVEFTTDSKIQTVGDSSYNEDIILSPNDSIVISSTKALQVPVGSSEDKPNTIATVFEGLAAYEDVSEETIDAGTASSIDPISYDGGGSVLSFTVGNVGSLRFNTDYNSFEGTSNSLGKVILGGIYSDDRRTNLVANSTTNEIEMTVDNALVATASSTGITINGLQVEDVNIQDNLISTNVSNSDLELRANGTGEVRLGDIRIKEATIKDSGNSLTFENTGYGKIKFAGSKGIAIPYGTTAERPANLGQPNPEIGDTRWNTTTEILETWDGNQYLSAAGVAAAISEQEFNDLLLEYTLIFG